MNYLKMCKKCKERNVGAFNGYYPFLDSSCNTCKECGASLITLSVSSNDFWTLYNISHDNKFLEAMIELHDKDIVEYELKMSQFRNQVEQQNIIHQQKQESNTPHCPHCNSTNIKPIGAGERIGSVAMLGMFSKKINKSFKCLDCKYTW